MKQQGSNFVTPAGIIILGILVLVAAYFGITALEALLVMMLLLSLTAWFWSRHALRHIVLKPEENECRSFPGQTMEADFTIINDKYLPLIWLETRFPLAEKDCIAPTVSTTEGHALKQRFLWIMPKQSVSWRQQAAAQKRGVKRYEQLELSSGDGFGLSSLSHTTKLSVPFRFVVYPSVHGVNLSPIIGRLKELEQHKDGYYSDPTLISTIRDYQPGDSIRNINWRQLARTGTLQVNVHESMRMTRFCLIPDLESFTYHKLEKQGDVEKVVTAVHEDKLEEILSLIASVIVAATEHKYLCSLVIPAHGTTDPRIIIPENLESQVPELLTALSEIDYQGQATSLPCYEMEQQAHLLGQPFLFSRKYKAPENTAGFSPVHFIQTPTADIPTDAHILDVKELSL